MLEIGSIFKSELNDKVEYWKITGIPHKSYGSFSYPVIRCNKNGKEFRDRNGFNAEWVEKNCTIIGVVALGTKANIDGGVKMGAKKRRITYLENVIANAQIELQKLYKEVLS